MQPTSAGEARAIATTEPFSRPCAFRLIKVFAELVFADLLYMCIPTYTHANTLYIYIYIYTHIIYICKRERVLFPGAAQLRV